MFSFRVIRCLEAVLSRALGLGLLRITLFCIKKVVIRIIWGVSGRGLSRFIQDSGSWLGVYADFWGRDLGLAIPFESGIYPGLSPSCFFEWAPYPSLSGFV